MSSRGSKSKSGACVGTVVVVVVVEGVLMGVEVVGLVGLFVVLVVVAGAVICNCSSSRTSNDSSRE